MAREKPPVQSMSSSWKGELEEWRASVKGKLRAGWGNGPVTNLFFSLAALRVLKVPAEQRLLKLEEINREMKEMYISKMTTNQALTEW